MSESEYERLLETGFRIEPCPKCGGKGIERVGEGTSFFLAGIPLDPTIGHVVVCEDCGFSSHAYREQWKAIADWNFFSPREK